MSPATWRVAPADVRWASERTDTRSLPARWGEYDEAADVLRLKDTRGKYWRNRLEAPNRFVYSFPREAKRDWERPFLHKLIRRVATQRPLRVHLFSTPGSRDEFYGEWVVSELNREETGRPDVAELTLLRLAEQSEDTRRQYVGGGRAAGAFRSLNEGAHDDALRGLFPASDGWAVRHEPETLLDLHEPSVVDGRPREISKMSRSYTCDFVVARGAARLCVESKPCEEAVTAEARAKCRVLRDTTLTRVVFMVGSGAETPRWLDMGPVGASAEGERWYPDATELRAALGV